jgi:hypothetical protein
MAGITEVVIFFLAVWRASKMVTEEEGPGMIFSRLRELSGAEVEGIPEDWNSLTWYGKLAQYSHCLSVWMAFAIALIYIMNKDMYRIVALSLSGSAATVLIEDTTNG